MYFITLGFMPDEFTLRWSFYNEVNTKHPFEVLAILRKKESRKNWFIVNWKEITVEDVEIGRQAGIIK